MGLFGLDTGSTTKTKLPGWLKGPTKDALKDIRKWIHSDRNYVYGTKKGEDLFTPLNKLMEGAFANVGAMGDMDIGKVFGLDKAKGLWGDYMKSGLHGGKIGDVGDYAIGGKIGGVNSYAQGGGVGSLKDYALGGKIGSVQDHMDPYLKEVLNPALREIREESDRQRRDIGLSATMGGAFGDARQGVLEGENFEKTNQALADTTGRIYSDAFNNAQDQRNFVFTNAQGQQNRVFDNAQAQRNLDIQRAMSDRNLAIERLGTGAAGLEGIGDNLFGKMQGINDTLLNAGDRLYQFEDKKRQTLQQFQEALKNKKYNDATLLLQALSGMPRESITNTENNTGLFGLLGSLVGGLF